MPGKATGEVIVIGDVVQHSEKFRSVQIVLKTEQKYKYTIPFKVHQDDADKFVHDINVGDEISVDYIEEGREYNGKYYVDLKVTNWGLRSAALIPAGEGTGGVGQSKEEMDEQMPF
jgi:adenine-specific DNA methylase